MEIARELGYESSTTIKRALVVYGIPRHAKRRGGPTPKSRQGFCGEISGSYLYSLRSGAAGRGFTFDVTGEYLWALFLKQERRCALSGVELVFAPTTTQSGKLLQTASLDRVDASLGYHEGNVQWIHKDLNRLKLHYPQSVFVDWCVKVAVFQKGRI